MSYEQPYIPQTSSTPRIVRISSMIADSHPNSQLIKTYEVDKVKTHSSIIDNIHRCCGAPSSAITVHIHILNISQFLVTF